ncbi:MAG: YvcK family protein [Candidatus Woesearchaeota archaeon]
MINIVTIGGGSGSFQLLLALKKINFVNISAIVTMCDNGGSTGILRTVYGILPPGDVRNCLVALSEESQVWTTIFSYRFDENLQSHNLGNLILTALTKHFNSFERALEEAHKLLNVKHKVIPLTYNHVDLKGTFSDGTCCIGEKEITEYCKKSKLEKLEIISEERTIFPNPKVIEAIRSSDFILVGPGSFYTSILSNLVFPSISDEINKSKAKKIYICNIMNDFETLGFTVKDYIQKIENFIKVDIIIVNSSAPPSELLEKYKEEGKSIPKIDIKDPRIIAADLLNAKNVLRHDPEKLGRLLEWIFLTNTENETKKA